MPRLTKSQLIEVLKAYIDPKKAGTTDFEITRNNLAGLIDKVGKIVTLDGSFQDKLAFLEGEELPLGKTVEEWYQDLLLATDYEANGENALAPAYPTYRKASYSTTLGRKKLKTTIKYDDYERACNNNGEYASLAAMVMKRLEDSEAAFRYQAKKQGLSVLCSKVTEAMNPSKTYAASTAYEVGEFVKKDSTPTAVGVIMKKLTSSNSGNWDANVKNGNIVELHLIEKIATPIDTTTGEAFIKQIKKDVETASFMTEGYSLNGNIVGAEEGLVLLIKKGIMPSLTVDTIAGAFNKEALALPAEVHVVDDFGDNTDAYAILADRRMLRLHNTYRATREQPNGDGDFLNIIRHTENTLFISRNTFVKVYKDVA